MFRKSSIDSQRKKIKLHMPSEISAPVSVYILYLLRMRRLNRFRTERMKNLYWSLHPAVIGYTHPKTVLTKVDLHNTELA